MRQTNQNDMLPKCLINPQNNYISDFNIRDKNKLSLLKFLPRKGKEKKNKCAHEKTTLELQDFIGAPVVICTPL